MHNNSLLAELAITALRDQMDVSRNTELLVKCHAKATNRGCEGNMRKGLGQRTKVYNIQLSTATKPSEL